MECERCFNIAEASPCPICADPARDQQMICVVEDPLDVLAVERTGAFRGVYHILHGALSPIDGVYPEKLRIAELSRSRAHDPSPRSDTGHQPQPGRREHRDLHPSAACPGRRHRHAAWHAVCPSAAIWNTPMR